MRENRPGKSIQQHARTVRFLKTELPDEVMVDRANLVEA